MSSVTSAVDRVAASEVNLVGDLNKLRHARESRSERERGKPGAAGRDHGIWSDRERGEAGRGGSRLWHRSRKNWWLN